MCGTHGCPPPLLPISTSGAPEPRELWHTPFMNTNNDELTHLRLRIEGAVQGVGYRAFVMTEARRLGIDGWIRNRSDGSVEALVSGANAAIEALILLCTKGPPGARVESYELHKAEPPADKGFRRRPTL